MRQINWIKWFKRIPLLLVFILSFLSLFFSLYFTIYGYCHLGNEKDEMFATFIVSFISLSVSAVALVVALKTFFSINVVSSITSMDGNVLQNEHYSVSYPKTIKSLSDAKDEKEFLDKVLSLMDANRKHTASCMAYAGWLQRIIDNLIWLAYVSTDSEIYKNAMKKLRKKIDGEYRKYSELSNGIQYTLEEHINLINSVILYIERSTTINDVKSQGFAEVSSLEDVRGGMIQNPVSRTVYYDYVGLSYHKKAKAIIYKAIGDFNIPNEREPEYYVKIYGHRFSEDEFLCIETLIEKSKKAFELGMAAAEGDLLWEGYIMYNRVRVRLLELVVFKPKRLELFNEAKEELQRVKKIRKKILFLYAVSNSYIGEKLQYEVDLIDQLCNAFCEFAKNIPGINTEG